MLLYAPALCLALAVLSVELPAGQLPETGRIVGRIRLTKRLAAKPLPSTAYPQRTVGNNDAPAIPQILNVVVYLKDVVHAGPLATSRAEIRQERESFTPHTLAITRGSTVDFPNGDPFFHNVFSLSRAATFNLGRFERGRSRGRVFSGAGTVKVFCDIHSHMSATILVFDHPHFTIPDLVGAFELPAVPAGQHTLVGWHERVGERSEKIRVEAGKPTSIELTVPVPVEDEAP